MQNAMNPVKRIGSQYEDVTRVLGHHDPKEVRGSSKEVFALVVVNPVPDLHPVSRVTPAVSHRAGALTAVSEDRH
jgi:hypothetical protein